MDCQLNNGSRQALRHQILEDINSVWELVESVEKNQPQVSGRMTCDGKYWNPMRPPYERHSCYR